MTSTLNTLSALALVMAALSATTLVTAGSASANGFGPGLFGGGHGPVIPPRESMPSGDNGGGHLISCGIGRGCTITGEPSRDHDGDRDHDRDYGRDRWHFHGGYFGWRYPVVAPVYDTTSCVYEYKFRTIFVPGFGLKRDFVKVCGEI
jgi:hypothetical protein